MQKEFGCLGTLGTLQRCSYTPRVLFSNKGFMATYLRSRISLQKAERDSGTVGLQLWKCRMAQSIRVPVTPTKRWQIWRERWITHQARQATTHATPEATYFHHILYSSCDICSFNPLAFFIKSSNFPSVMHCSLNFLQQQDVDIYHGNQRARARWQSRDAHSACKR